MTYPDDILIEWHDDESGIEKASLDENLEAMKNQSEKAINMAMGQIRVMARRVAHAMNDLEDKVCPDEVAIEFGINLDAEVGAFVAKASTGAQLKVKFKWTIEQPQHPKINVSD
jgi:hypothetical protein